MKQLLVCTALLLLLLVPARSVEKNAEGVKAAVRVREIFEAKCNDCHGAELPRPKGKFGYVLDLKRMADNPEYVERGKPDNSELFKMVFNDEMPGEDANVPPLTAEEKEIVRQWIQLGAPDAPPATGDRTAATAPATAAPEAKPAWPLWKKAIEWVGRFHPVSTHIPVGLMMVAVLAEGLAWWTRKDSWHHTVRFLVIVAAFGAVSAGSLGWVNAYFSSYSKEPWALLWWHRWLGTATVLWTVICAVLVVIHECQEGSKERQRFRGALLLGAGLVSVSGFLGSALIYGLDHYAWK